MPSNVGLIIGIGLLVLFVNAMIASNMSDSAHEKGHDKRRYFHLCFWLGIFGCLCVTALPDRVANEQREQLLAQLQYANSTKYQGTNVTMQDAELPPL